MHKFRSSLPFFKKSQTRCYFPDSRLIKQFSQIDILAIFLTKCELLRFNEKSH